MRKHAYLVAFFLLLIPALSWGADFTFPALTATTGQTYTMTLKVVNGSATLKGLYWTGAAWSANATDLATTETGGTNGDCEYALTTGISQANFNDENNLLVKGLLHDGSGNVVGVAQYCYRCQDKSFYEKFVASGWNANWDD